MARARQIPRRLETMEEAFEIKSRRNIRVDW